MQLDKLALICVIILAAIWATILLTSAIAMLPYGLPVLIAIAIGGYFVYRVVKERLENKEDDYYDKNIKQ